jgi:hypothetical protein
MKCVLIYLNQYFCGSNQFDIGPRSWTFDLNKARIYNDYDTAKIMAESIGVELRGRVHVESEAELRIATKTYDDP